MTTKEIVDYLESLFDTRDNEKFYDECGIVYDSGRQISKIGYATNLTLDVINKAQQNEVDFIITHHDAWQFIYGLKDACVELLKAYGISHYYIHLPLDDCSFGTNASLAAKLDMEILEESFEEDGFLCGRIMKPKIKMTFRDLALKVESVLGEKVQAWQFNDKVVERVGLVCGGGGLSPEVNLAYEKGCDTYITGEKILYTLELAEFKKMNLIIGSHTFTELFGVEALVNKITNHFTELESLLIQEKRLESDNHAF